MVTLSLNKLIINVNNEIKPCHSPIKKPAGSASNFTSPGAHDETINNKIITGTQILSFDVFITLILLNKL